MDAAMNEADPSSPVRFLLLVTASSYLLKLLTDEQQPPANDDASTTEELFARLSSSAEHLSGQFPVLLVLVGAVGVYYLARADRAAAVFTGVPFVGWLVHALTDGVKDFYVFLIPAYLIFAVWISFGAAVLLRRTESLARIYPSAMRRAAPIALCALAFAVLFIGAWGTYGENDRSGDYRGRALVEAVAENAAPGATILHHRSSLWYMVLVEERRRDLTLVDPFKTSWIRYNDIVWPEPLTRPQADARYDLDDLTGVAAAREAARNGPVYVLDPKALDGDEAGLAFFRNAGFDVVRADEGGELYELVPPGREPRG